MCNQRTVEKKVTKDHKSVNLKNYQQLTDTGKNSASSNS